MRIVANENVPGPLITSLRELGHDVLSVKDSMAGAEDLVVLARAQTEGRIVLCDTDFGDLAFRSGLPSESGVVLIRIDWTNPEADSRAIVAAVTSRDDWVGPLRGGGTRPVADPTTATCNRSMRAPPKSFDGTLLVKIS